MDKDVAWNTSCAEGLAEVLYKVNYSMYCTHVNIYISKCVCFCSRQLQCFRFDEIH